MVMSMFEPIHSPVEHFGGVDARISTLDVGIRGFTTYLWRVIHSKWWGSKTTPQTRVKSGDGVFPEDRLKTGGNCFRQRTSGL